MIANVYNCTQKIAAMIVITLLSCVYLLNVIDATSACDDSLYTDSNIVQSDSAVNLTCRVCHPVQDINVEFRHNTTTVANRVFALTTIFNITLHRFTISSDNDVTILTLTILKFLESSTGSYSCIHRFNGTNSTQFMFMWLSVPVTSVALTPEDQVLNVVEGLPISYVKCVSSPARPSPVITWYLDNWTQATYSDDINITKYTNASSSNNVTTSTLAFKPTKEVTNQSIYCNVFNGYEVISSTHRLRLNILTYPSRPIIRYKDNEVNDAYIIKGRNISIECFSIGVPTPFVNWKTPSGDYINSTILTIPIMQNGSYNCSAQSILKPSHGAEISALNTSVFSVNMLSPPEVINCTIGAGSVVSSGIVMVVQNEPFEINCTSDGNPAPTNYNWLMPDGNVSSETKLALSSVKSIGNNSYTLRVINTMKGTFDTDVTVGYFTAKFTFDILYPPMKPDLYYNGSTKTRIKTSVIHVIRGQNASILCNTSSNPNPNYNWFVDDIQTTTARIWNDKIQNNTRVQCNVSNTMNATGKLSVTASTTSLVTIEALFAPDTPTFSFHACGKNVKTNYLKVIEGRSVNGTCTTRSNPSPIYSWIPSTFGHLSSFLIGKSNASNSGNYTCTAINTMNTTFDGTIEGNINSSFFLDILVPVDIQSIANATVVLNGNYSVECPYKEGNPSKVSLTWVYIGTNQTMSTVRTLTLPIVKLSDEGYYTCKVSYSLEPTMCGAQDGYDESSFYLDVQYAAKISRFHAVGFNVSSNSITINESKSVTLLCEVDSDPVAYVAVINTTRGSNHLLIGQHNNTIAVSLGRAQCEYDMGVYECKGNNTHNKVQQVRRIEILINCAPRPSPFFPINTTIYRKTKDSLIIIFTFVAYPPPSNLNAYVWKKLISNEWVTLQNSSGFFIHISNDRLQTNLSKLQLHSDDFTNYTVHVNNDIGSWEHNFVIRANEQPSAPERFEVVEDLVTENSVTIEWQPGFDGGEEQKFVILYKKATDKTWTNASLSGAITRIVVDGLSPGTAYEVKMYAENTIGKSEETALQHVVTKSYSDTSRSSAVTAIGAGVGGSIVCIVVIIGVVFIIRRRRNNGAAKRTSQRKFNFKKNGETAYVNYQDMSTHTDGVGNKISTCSITNPAFKQSTDTPSPPLADGLQRTPSFVIVPEPLYGNFGDFKLKIKSILIQELRIFTWQCKQDPTDVFRDFFSLDSGLKYETTAACSEVNVTKNRYKNMYPYDKNRVRLPVIDGEDSSDFINASFIDVMYCISF